MSNTCIYCKKEIVPASRLYGCCDPCFILMEGSISTPERGIVPKRQDIISHPSHYNSGKIEVIEAIEDWKLGYHRGNAIKYIARAGRKNPDKEIEDLQKALWYINREIVRLEAFKKGEPPAKPNDTPVLKQEKE